VSNAPHDPTDAPAAIAASFRVEVGDRHHRFGRDVDLVHHQGVLALVGPSGCGKTLTLRVLAGLLRPVAGRVSLLGKMVESTENHVHVPPERRRVGYVPQDAKLFPHLTVEGNVRFGLRGESDDRQIFDRAAELTAISPLLGRRTGELSGGERQRVALARALASAPQLLLLDEPFSALDAPAREALRERLRAVLAALHLPAVLVSHDVDEVRALADEVTVLEGG
jgi:ABC-type molybdate transport system ATPase subunit